MKKLLGLGLLFTWFLAAAGAQIVPAPPLAVNTSLGQILYVLSYANGVPVLAPSGLAVVNGVLQFNGVPLTSVAGGLSVKTYGALCNWNGSVGTDDTVAFQATFTAAGVAALASGAPVPVSIPYGCTLGTSGGQTTLTVPAGVYLEGPGSIFVPAQSANPLLLMTSTGDNEIRNLKIKFATNLTACGVAQNNSACAAIRWDGASPGTGTTYARVSVLDNTILDSGWGIALIAQTGSDALTDVHVNRNTVTQSTVPITAYKYADAIHLGGAISAFEIAGNVVTGRNDAGIAVTTEAGSKVCSDGVISGNTIYEDLVGVDVSGCSKVTVTGNDVRANIATSTSNPAFRAIYYNALPQHTTVTGNTFENYESSAGSPEYAVKFDCFNGGCGSSGTITSANYFDAKLTGNKFYSMYLRGSQVDVSANTVELGGKIELDWDTVNGNGSTLDTFGTNSWQGSGTFSNDSRSDVYSGDVLASQIVAAGSAITYTNPNQLSAVPLNSSGYSANGAAGVTKTCGATVVVTGGIVTSC